jgi:ATPase family associated with various cellular activities (AAA)
MPSIRVASHEPGDSRELRVFYFQESIRNMERNEKMMSTGLAHEVYRLPQLVWGNRIVRAAEQGIGCYPIFRKLHFAARIELEVLLDAIALDPVWRVERLAGGELFIDGEGVFVVAYGSRKPEYCSCVFFVWAADVAKAEAAKARILAKAGSTRITEPMFTIDWNFLTSNGIDSAEIEELASDVVHDSAYPEIAGGVHAFIARYLDARETVLVLQGPPGTGKTRLIRAILAEMSRRKGDPARAMYTGDAKALESDALFVKFITGEDDAFVMEDADHVMKPRADGNDHLHRFLTIADGVVRSQGRKIIFSTNLPNVGDLDEALVRPGRCFARLFVRKLTAAEAKALAIEIAAGDAEKAGRVSQAFSEEAARGRSLAEVYQALE